MNQKNPLLNYRIKCNVEESTNTEEISYDFTAGLWRNKLGEPIIKRYVNCQAENISGETLITETREGVDRSEGSSIDLQDNQINSEEIEDSFGQTIMTATREGIDRAENSYVDNNVKSYLNFSGETLVTRTREGVDRSEGSSMETLITYTRESADRSEKS